MKTTNIVAVTIAGSYRKHFRRLWSVKQTFEDLGAQVLRPLSEPLKEEDDFVSLIDDEKEAQAAHLKQFEAIRRSQLLYVVNPAGYIGLAAALNIAYAAASNPRPLIILSEPTYEPAIEALIDGVGEEKYAFSLLQKDV